MGKREIKELVAGMTLEEKAGLCSGSDFWHTKAVERLGIPKIMVSDGPHGLRKQRLTGDHLGVNESIKAVCFPTASCMAASFDRELLYKVGQRLGNQCQAENVAVLLGPAMNIKRSPLCGRNFEYFSEDPYLTGELAKYHVMGVQSKNVGTSPKHFACNNQETRRNSQDSIVDERTLREIYLAAFETVVRDAKPWTMMCSYNRLNGELVSQNKKLLTDILRDEFLHDGIVMSDWGAVSDRVKGIEAGLDLEMPSSYGIRDAEIVQAVKAGELDEQVLDKTVERMLELIYKYVENRDESAVWDQDADHEFAVEVAGESIVLLKNEGVLPLEPDERFALIGEFAENPRVQGGGSSHINCHKIDSVKEYFKSNKYVTYARGYDIAKDETDEELLEEAIETARRADKAVLFVGLPDAYECEGYDRKNLKLPDYQTKLIEEIIAVQPNTIIVMHNGAPVEMPWIHEVKAVLEGYLGGQVGATAIAQMLVGKMSPSGRLAETFPLRLEDTPSYLYYGGDFYDEVEYREGVFVGYRYYMSKDMPVLFPFGYGLTYTMFKYSNVVVDKTSIMDDETVTVSVDVKNVGNRDGKEVVQLYVADVESSVKRPVRELKGFEKVAISAGETKTVTFTLDKRSFAYYNTRIHDWYVEEGDFELQFGQNARDIVAKTTIHVAPKNPLLFRVTKDTLVADIKTNAKMAEILEPFIDKYNNNGLDSDADVEGSAKNEAITAQMIEASNREMPLRHCLSFSKSFTQEELDDLISRLNEAQGITESQ